MISFGVPSRLPARALASLLLLLLVSRNLTAQAIIPPDSGIDPRPYLPSAAEEPMLRFLAERVRENIPEHYADERDWAKTEQIYAGFKVRRDGWELKTKRHWKTVNQGLWRRYEVDLISPDETLEVRLSDVYWTAEGRLHFVLELIADLKVLARQARWNLDVQLYSVKLIARSRVRLAVEASVGFGWNPTQFPPALIVDPHVQQAEIEMVSFEMDRIGDLGGDFAEELGKAVEGVIRRELVEPQSRKLADKLNHQIEKHQDDLQLSLGRWLGEWLSSAG